MRLYILSLYLQMAVQVVYRLYSCICVVTVPKVITYCSENTFQANFHTALKITITSNQSHITTITSSELKQHYNRSTLSTLQTEFFGV